MSFYRPFLPVQISTVCGSSTTIDYDYNKDFYSAISVGSWHFTTEYFRFL